MSKINYQNLPSTATPLNSANLNAMQENILEYKTFNIPSESSVTLSFAYSTFLLLFSAKGSLGGAQEAWIICAYGNGGTSRNRIYKLFDAGTRALTYEIVDQTIIITNPNGTTMNCSITFLVGNSSQVTVS